MDTTFYRVIKMNISLNHDSKDPMGALFGKVI